MDPSTYRRTLVEISKRLRPGELETMKFMLSEHIPKRRMEEIKSALQLFEALEEREMLGSDNLGTLRQLLVDASEGRTDLVSLLDKSTTSGQSTPLSPRPPSTHLSQGQDFSQEFQYLSCNLGRNWKKMCRQLPGISEQDLDAAIEYSPRDLQEQILRTLRLWQTKNQNTASMETIIQACRKADLALHAEKIEDQNFQ